MAVSLNCSREDQLLHPIIRIVTFFVAAAFLSVGALPVVLLMAAGLLVLMVRSPNLTWRMPLVLFRRLRWLLLSLLIVYGWFTPGVALWPVLGAVTPTVEGLTEGLLRTSSLLLIALAAQLLLLDTARPQLLAALYWLALPLRVVGVSRERLALRLALTLDAVPQLSKVVTPALYQGLSGNTITRFGQIAARAVQGVLDQADQQDNRAIEIDTPARPPVYQWLYPLMLGIGLGII